MSVVQLEELSEVEMKPIVIIPARSGSKGLQNKNMLFLSGRPMIFHTIDAAIDSGCFEIQNIFISTDSKLYGEICKERGVSISYRDAELASDTATTYDVLVNFLEPFPDDQVFVVLQPTSPLRNGKQVEEAYRIFSDAHHENVVSFSEVDKHPKLFTTLSVDGMAKDIVGVDKGYHRQDTQPLYYPNGAIFISTKKSYLSNQSFFTDKTYAYLMDKKTSLDVDSHVDFVHAIGDLYFDYQSREVESEETYSKFYRDSFGNCSVKNIILGDSRTEDIKLSHFDNLSIGGVTLSTLLKMLEKIDSEKFETILLSMGINDIGANHSFETIVSDFTKIFDKFSGKKIYVTTIPYTIFRAEGNNDLVSSVNDWLKRYTSEKGINLIDLNQVLSVDNHLRYELTYDGLHFNHEGQEKLEGLLKSAINGNDSIK